MVKHSKKSSAGSGLGNLGVSTGAKNRTDPAWNHCVEVVHDGEEKRAYKYVRCNYCEKVVKGGVSRLKNHLAGTRVGVKPCDKVPEAVKQQFVDLLNKLKTKKNLAQMEFEQSVEVGSYFGSGREGEDEGNVASGGSVSKRGIRGPMDRYMVKGNSSGEQTTTIAPPQNAKELRQQVCLDIGRFFYENAIPFNAARSPSFVNMLRSVGAYGRGLKPPTMYELRTWILKEELKTTERFVDDIKSTWPVTGVSIMSDGWQDVRHRSLINFLVNNPSGTVFLKCVDASEHVKDAKLLFRLLDEVVEEVGEEIVVQVITDNASNYRAAGLMLMEKRKHLYWTPCAAHCLDLMLEKIGELPQHKNALIKAKKVSNYIYNHSWVLSLMRQFTNRELIRPAATRFATSYLTLQSIYQLRQPLESMFTSEKWTNSNYASKADGKEVRKIILKDNNFWLGLIYAIKTTKPLVEVLRLVDGEKEPAMGFLYNAMDEAKEKIAKNLGGEEKDYKEIWDIIDEKWDFQMHRHLHAAAYYLNPRCHYSPDFSTHTEIKLGLFHCLDKLIPNRDDMEKADLQCSFFHNREGFFGLAQAKNTVHKRTPVDWWTQYGDGTPELQKFAIKVLGLTCSSSGCERNWSAFNQVHTKRRNRLTTMRMNALVYILYNKKLKDRHLKLKSLVNDEDSLLIDELPSDDEWLVGENDEDAPHLTVDDLDVDVLEGEPSQATQTQPNESSSKKVSAKGGSSKGKGKLHLVDEDEDDWEDFDNEDDEALELDDASDEVSL